MGLTMLLGDLSRTAHKTLKALPYPHYLAAAWIITRELEDLYGPATPQEWRPLVDDSLGTLRAAATRGAEAVTAEANALLWRWCEAMGIDVDDPDNAQPVDSPVRSGHTNLWFAWLGLMAELGGQGPRNEGLEPTMRAVTMYHDGVQPLEPVTAQSAGMVFSVRMLNSFLLLAELLGRMPEGEPVDLDGLRERVFRQPV
ncbi:hypothetical protein ACFQO7_32505 [Catellatospora aurea]|uniref:Uncharacterized protein n=1 Tax=Catellatospora aurea TaxID=1337874 RepID=A0ABW2H9F2_9ACTN